MRKNIERNLKSDYCGMAKIHAAFYLKYFKLSLDKVYNVHYNKIIK